MSSPGVWAHYICAKMLPAISYVLIRVELFPLKIKLRKQWNSENLTDCDIGDCQWQHIENGERTPNTPTVQGHPTLPQYKDGVHYETLQWIIKDISKSKRICLINDNCSNNDILLNINYVYTSWDRRFYLRICVA